MAFSASAAARNAATDAVVDLLDAGSGAAQGKLRIRDSTTTLVDLDLSNPAFGASSSGVATAASISTEDATAAGTADNWQLLDRDDNVIISGDVRASADADNGEELVLDNTNIAVGQSVSVSSFTFDAMPNP